MWIFRKWDAGSNLRKQLSAGGAFSYWDFS
jgi:hypothetical protein